MIVALGRCQPEGRVKPGMTSNKEEERRVARRSSSNNHCHCGLDPQSRK
jgi:hypothetical protein